MSTFTSAQTAAIAARGDVLVIAGAGTGKTRTLIARCLQLLREGASLDRMLLVTFTEAAAAEMRVRLRKSLEDELKAATPIHTAPPQTPDPRPQTRSPDLAEHLALLDTAQISTLHSFCLRLVREHFHHLEIDPQLVILDERQTRPLARDCLTALLAEHYAGRHSHSDAVQQLIRRAGRGSDEHLRVLVWKLHCYTQTLPDPDAWFAAQLASFSEESPTRWQDLLLSAIEEWRNEWLPALASAPDVPALKQAAAALANLAPVGRDSVEPHIERSEASAASISGGDTTGQKTRSARASSVGRWGSTESHPTSNDAPPQLLVCLTTLLAADAAENWKRKKTELRPPFAKLFDEAAFFHGLLVTVPRAGGLQPPSSASNRLSTSGETEAPDGDCKSPARAPLAEDWDWCRHEMAALVRLAQQFTTRFGEAKRQLGGVDFADLEQFTLRLLRDPATGVARHCRAQFTHVCVDEYQDINAAQDAILRLISGEGGDANRFLVGDLKQSIYRFRLANPRIFAGYAQAWRGLVGRDSVEPHIERSEASAASTSGSTATSQETRSARASSVGKRGSTESHPTHAGSVIALSENFRSREAVLNFVNPLFRALMRESIGGVAYDAEAELKFGNPEGRAELRNPVPAASSRRPNASTTPDLTQPTERRLEAVGTSRVELHILTKDADSEADEHDTASDVLDLLGIEREARCVALRLRTLHDARHEVWDEELGTLRPAAWRDMVVLMRSPGSRVESFAQEFHRAGVPLQAARGGFYEALEVSDLLNLLRLLDNPLQDLPLLAVLRSPLVAMSLEELVAIRAHNDERLFWDALTKFCAAGARTPTVASVGRDSVEPHIERSEASAASISGDVTHGQETRSARASFVGKWDSTESHPTSEFGASSPATDSAFRTQHSAFAKASAFLARFAIWRDRLRLSSLTDCLERVLAETHYESLLLAEPRGAERVANVRRLLDLARQFDPYQRQGLHRFLQFITAQEEAELDHAPAPAATDNAVRLMSIHQSKGLEFPVVVVAGLGTLFNERDLRGDILLDEELGLCPMVSPPGRERRYPSLPHWLASRRGRRELLGEELRLLYVALTRARDTLLLVGTDTGKDVAEKWRGPAAELSDLALLKARCPLNWLRAWLPSVTRDEDWRSDSAGVNELLGWDFYTVDDERLAQVGRDSAEPQIERSEASISGSDASSQEARSARASFVGKWGSTESHPTEDLERLRRKLDWRYTHVAAMHEPAKTSVTVLRRRAAEADEAATQWFRPRGGEARQKRGELSAAQLGVAHHVFLQCVDLARTATALDLRNEAARLVAEGFLAERDADGLDFAALLTFWESSVGKQVRANAGRVQREVPFTARFTVAELQEMGLMAADPSRGRSEVYPSELESQNRERRAENQRLLTSSPTGGEEFIIVQGVADLVVFGEREIWLLDYKTDHFEEAEIAAKTREHGPQLTLYAEALERIYKKPVTRTWLHFLALGRTELL